MADEDVLRRIDVHLARGNELMELNREALDMNREAFDRNRVAFQELRGVIRESAARSERVTDEIVGELRDLRRETRAQTQAIFHVLDRLGPGGAKPEPA